VPLSVFYDKLVTALVKLVERPKPQPAINDVVVRQFPLRVMSAVFTMCRHVRLASNSDH